MLPASDSQNLTQSAEINEKPYFNTFLIGICIGGIRDVLTKEKEAVIDQI